MFDCPHCGDTHHVKAELYDHMKLVAEANGFKSLTEAIARATAAEARADRLASAMTDLVSWFDKPVQGDRGMVWVIRAGDQGADDAVTESRAALQQEG